MGTQPPTEQPGPQRGDRVEWDGQQWKPIPRPGQSRRNLFEAVAAAAIFLVGMCSGAIATSSSSNKAQPAATTAPAAAVSTPTPTATPTPVPATPVPATKGLINSEGTGSKVLDLDIPKGRYKFPWRVEGAQFDNFIVHLEGQGSRGLVNELVGPSSFGPPGPSSGEAFIELGGGRYQLVVKTSTTKWWTTFTPL